MNSNVKEVVDLQCIVMLRVHFPAARSYQTTGMLGELALMALSVNYCDLDPEIIRILTGAFKATSFYSFALC